MRLRTFLFATTMFTICGVAVSPAQTLSGKVSSTEEGLMEGVLVSAKKEGSTVTTTVVTNDKGQFSFPAGRLEPGKYTITIRAVGYTLVGPKTVDVTASGGTAEVKLGQSAQHRAAALQRRMDDQRAGPGSVQGVVPARLPGLPHAPARVHRRCMTPSEWKQVFTRMGRYAPESTPAHPQLIVQGGARSERPRVAANMMQQAAEYLEKVSLANPDRLEYDFKTLPRPKGKATKVVITEWDLPRKEAQPHDVVIDADGHAWYSDFGAQFVGELDPKTGKVVDHKLELLRPEQPKGSLDIELDPDGNLWVGMSYQGGAAKIDRKTKKVTTYPLNKEWLDLTTQTNMVTPTHMNVDNKVWMTDYGDPQHLPARYHDREMGEHRRPPRSPTAGRSAATALPTDKDNNVYMLEFGGNSIGMRNAKTDEVKIWSTPLPRTRPRRGRFDDQGRLWFAEYGGNAIGMFDPDDREDEGVEAADAVGQPVRRRAEQGRRRGVDRLDVERLRRRGSTPRPRRSPNICCRARPTSGASSSRRPSGRPVLWIGNNHGAAIIKVEPAGLSSQPIFGTWQRPCVSAAFSFVVTLSLSSFRLDVVRTDDLAPLLGFVGNQLTEIGGRTGNTVLPKSASRAMILGSASAALISLLSLSMMSAGVPRGANAAPEARLVAGQGFIDSRDIGEQIQRVAVALRARAACRP